MLLINRYLFPFFRAYFYGSGRLLINAILLWPGFGAEQEVEG